MLIGLLNRTRIVVAGLAIVALVLGTLIYRDMFVSTKNAASALNLYTVARRTVTASITGSGLYSTTRIVAGVNNTNTSGGSVTIDASTGNTETVTMSGTSTNVTINGLSNCQQGEWLTVDVIAGVANRTISFASPPFHGGGSVSSTGLNNHYRQLFYCDTGTDAYAVSPLQTAQ